MPAVFIAGGIGITPMLSIVLWCLEIHPAHVLHLYDGLRNTTEYAFRASLEAIVSAHSNFRFTAVLSGPWPTEAADEPRPAPAFIAVDLLRRTLPAGRHRFHVRGPAVIMEEARQALFPEKQS